MEAKRNSTDLPDADASGPRTQKDKQEDMGGAGVYSLPLQARPTLAASWLNPNPNPDPNPSPVLTHQAHCGSLAPPLTPTPNPNP
jgi:hypothetical protein